MDKILMTYVILIKKGEITLDEVPEDYREQVEKTRKGRIVL
jgi:hypothetical protein